MKTEEAKELIDQQIQSLGTALDSGHSEQLQSFLSTMARFHRYSLGNVLLIMAQQPDATHVAGFHTWKSLGRFVKAGEKGIAILAPMALKNNRQDASGENNPGSTDEEESILRFRVVYVFDVTQTDGEPLPDFAKVAGDPGDYAERLKGLVRQLSIELEYSEQLGGAFGISKGGTIVLQQGLDPAQEFTTLVHELAHEIPHHMSTISDDACKVINFLEGPTLGSYSLIARSRNTRLRRRRNTQIGREHSEWKSLSAKIIH